MKGLRSQMSCNPVLGIDKRRAMPVCKGASWHRLDVWSTPAVKCCRQSKVLAGFSTRLLSCHAVEDFSISAPVSDLRR